MAELPFQQPQTLNLRQNRALALAAVFQATQLTHMTAMSGQQSMGESGGFYLSKPASISAQRRMNPVKPYIFSINLPISPSA